MAPRRQHRTAERTPEDKERLQALREQVQREQPTPEELRTQGHAFVPMGEVMALRALLAGLREERQRQGLTLRDLAERTGIDEPALSRLETGKNLNPTWETLAKVAKALGLALGVELKQRKSAKRDEMSQTTLTPDESRILRQFLTQYDGMIHSRFVAAWRSGQHRLLWEADEEGQLRLNVPDYDEEDFRAFLTYYRPVGIGQTEPTFLPKVRGIVQRHAPEHQPLYAIIQAEIEPKLAWKDNKTIQQNQDGSTSFNAHALFDVVTNGMIFHLDACRDAHVEKLRRQPRVVYFWVFLSEIVSRVMNACNHLVRIIIHHPLLSDDQVPPRLLALFRTQSSAT
jgi:transcriptional regulator with XRE-family HTH domain